MRLKFLFTLITAVSAIIVNSQNINTSFSCSELKKIAELANGDKLFDLKLTSYNSKLMTDTAFKFKSRLSLSGAKESFLYELSGYAPGSPTAGYLYVAVLGITKTDSKTDSLQAAALYKTIVRKLTDCFTSLGWKVTEGNDDVLVSPFVDTYIYDNDYQCDNFRIRTGRYRDEKLHRYVCYIDIAHHITHEDDD